MYHQSGEQVTFTAQYPTRLWEAEYKPGDEIILGLVRDWDEAEGLGEGGPWNYGGYPCRLLASLAGDTECGHAHTCLNCGHEIEYGAFEDCEGDTDHAFCLCDVCAAAGVDANA